MCMNCSPSLEEELTQFDIGYIYHKMTNASQRFDIKELRAHLRAYIRYTTTTTNQQQPVYPNKSLRYTHYIWRGNS